MRVERQGKSKAEEVLSKYETVNGAHISVDHLRSKKYRETEKKIDFLTYFRIHQVVGRWQPAAEKSLKNEWELIKEITIIFLCILEDSRFLRRISEQETMKTAENQWKNKKNWGKIYHEDAVRRRTVIFLFTFMKIVNLIFKSN